MAQTIAPIVALICKETTMRKWFTDAMNIIVLLYAMMGAALYYAIASVQFAMRRRKHV